VKPSFYTNCYGYHHGINYNNNCFWNGGGRSIFGQWPHACGKMGGKPKDTFVGGFFLK
jgi:hypothetical protein